jgi:hypothetical protein
MTDARVQAGDGLGTQISLAGCDWADFALIEKT